MLRLIDSADESVCSTRDALCVYTLACDFQKRSQSSHSSFQSFLREMLRDDRMRWLTVYETFTPEVAMKRLCMSRSISIPRFKINLKFIRSFDQAFDLLNSTNSVAKGIKSAFTVEY